MKNRLCILVLLAVILTFSSACALDTSQYDKLLSTDDVKNALANAGLHLEECYSIKPDEFALNGVTPTVWEIANKRADHIFIYTFDSFRARKSASEEYYGDHFRLSLKPYLRENWVPISYETKNIFVFYTVKSDTYYPKALPVEMKLTRHAINDLACVEQIIFTGESKHWQGKITLRQYEHILTADGKILTYDQWVEAGSPQKVDVESLHRIYPHFTYKGADISNIDTIRFQISEPGGGTCRGSERFLNKFRTSGGVGFGSSGLGATKDDIYKMSISWNGLGEVMELRAR